jgi:hypothetical protein
VASPLCAPSSTTMNPKSLIIGRFASRRLEKGGLSVFLNIGRFRYSREREQPGSNAKYRRTQEGQRDKKFGTSVSAVHARTRGAL